MKKLGVIEPDCELSPPARQWSDVKHEAWERRNMEVYAAMVDNMDQGIGRIVAQLEKDGRLDNTLIMYLQDNGGCAEGLGRQPRGKFTQRPAKPPFAAMDKDALQTSMIPQQTRDGYPLIMGPGALAGPADTYIAYGQGWANVSNTPFREYKHWVHEGGISSPLIVHWPAKIKQRGALRSQPGHLIDLMATCVDVSGANYPEEFNGRRIAPMEGASLAAACIDNAAIDREAIYWEHEGNRAVRVGDWKLVAKGEKGAWELYNIAADRAEQNNLADAQPEKVKQLSNLWQAWAKRADVLPLGAWRGNFKPNPN
jgi:arylsulfatase